jgi:hypothetical protein
MEDATWYGELALDKSIATEKFYSLRQWLMNLTSIQPKLNKDNKQYHDRVFSSIHKANDGQETRFYFSKVNSTEATNIIAALPLLIRDELKLDPTCFVHKSDAATIMEGTWEIQTRTYKNKHMLNQEQYMEDMDEFFCANKSFLGHTVEVPPLHTTEDERKQVAMANGEDDVSLLSNLTDKTLRDANTPGPVNQEDGASVQSGMTSRSKTQLAVKEALKAVSLEHKKALQEQQQKFQKELEVLKQSLTQATPKTKNKTVIQLEEDSSRGTDDGSDTTNSLTSLQHRVQELNTSSRKPAAKRANDPVRD